MTTSEAEPPRDSQPEQAFNFDVMSDHRVILLGRSIMLGIEHELDKGRDRPDDDMKGVLDLYIGGMARLLDRDPGRAKAILKRQALSEDRWDALVAVRFTPTLARHDFELARDIVVYNGNKDREDDVEGIVFDTAVDASIEISHNATREQSADLDRAEESAHQVPWPEEYLPPGLAT